MENQNPYEIKIGPDSSPGIVRIFFQDTMAVLTEPGSFFRKRFEEMSLNHALAFGLLISWIAAFLDWITRAVKHESLMDGFLKIRDQLHQLPIWKDLPADIWAQGTVTTAFMPAWGMEGLRMIVNPFHSLISFFIYGVIFWLGATVLIGRENPLKNTVTITNVVKITAISAAASIVGSILGFLPLKIGSFLGWIYHTALLMIGFSERFQISRLRGLAIVFLPSLVTIVVFSCVIGVIVSLFAGVIASLFH